MALMMTLALLVLISMLVIGFLFQSTFNHKLSFGSAGQLQSQMIARTCLDSILIDLQTEIYSGSTAHTELTPPIYLPITNHLIKINRNVPTNLTSLVRVSKANEAEWKGSGYQSAGPIRSSHPVPASEPATSGHRISDKQWLKPQLMGESLPNGFLTPEFFLITRSGPLLEPEPSLQILSNSNSTNRLFALGRFAYAIYDVGGLLDINVAGNPLEATNNVQRGRLHQADLSQIPGFSNPKAFFSWRNAGSRSDPNWFFENTNSFLLPHPGDQKFVTRQDLIKYSKDHPDVINQKALPYLTIFNREKNIPTYSPTTPNTTNVNLALVTTPNGHPLLKKRFPLTRLSKITPTSTADRGSEIYKYFGLTRNNSSTSWTYNHGSATAIYTLAEVAQNRGNDAEPDFFELLKSVILEGSLGKTAGDPANASKDTAFRTADLDSDLDRQILQIGASIIDQYDSDSWPTTILFSSNDVYGIENLPYINRSFDAPYRPNGGLSYENWYEFEIWNPHQNSTVPQPDGPTSFRITATSGGAYIQLNAGAGTYTSTINNFTTGSTFVTFNSQNFSAPTLLNSANSVCDRPSIDAACTVRGLYIGTLNPGLAAGVLDVAANTAGAIPQNFPTFELQYKTASGQYITYQKLRNLRTSNRAGGLNFYKTLSPNRSFNFFVDPRNSRFGGSGNSGRPPGQLMRGVDGPPNTYADPYSEGKYTVPGPYGTNPGWTLLRYAPVNITHVRLGALANNDALATSRYTSPDGILRWADGGLRGAADNPMAAGNSAARPLILNREFRSVGELGYAFRGEPWKTLDFFTTNSADAGLLDVFSISDASTIAGGIDLNSPSSEVLLALLAGAGSTEFSASNTLSSTVARTMVTDLLQLTQTNPLMNKAELVTRLSNTKVNSTYPAIKTQREALIRALAESGQTRTWNLMIDLIAQTGKFAPGAKSYSNFTVEGEKRYWLHVAIDRFTGEIIDQQMEVVNE